MSVRAYREITPPAFADYCSFNLWHEQEVLDGLVSLSGTHTMGNDDGYSEIEVDIVELAEFVKDKDFVKVCDPETLKMLKRDIKETAKNGDNYIIYHCW